MGGDFAPANVVEGALAALDESKGRLALVLVGQQERIEDELRTLGHPTSSGGERFQGLLSVRHAPEVIDMHDPPTAALRTKKESSIAVGLRLHTEGAAQAFVSAGNTGAVMSASTLILGRMKGVGRPTIGALVPTAKTPCFLLDAGANVDCRSRHLFEFAVMGSIFVSSMLGKADPAVGLLSIGEEETKGNEVTLETLGMLKQSRLNFIGNVEGGDIFKGEVDVIVCDGFTGNILLKFGESVPAFIKTKFVAFAAQSFTGKLIGLVARKGLRAVMKELDYQEHGGVPLLGVNGVSIIGHGRSTPKAIKNMIYRAEEMVSRKVNTHILEALQKYS